MLKLIIFLTILCTSCSCYKILCVYAMPGKSHVIITQALCRELAARNHQVTAITPFPSSKPIPNYREISTADMSDFIDKQGFNFMTPPEEESFSDFFMLLDMFVNLCDTFLSHPNVKQLLESDETFDLIYTEMFSDESIFAGLSQRFKAPVVILNTFIANFWANNLVGNPAPYSYIPNEFLTMDTRMTFTERLSNVLFGTLNEMLYKFYYLPKQDAVMRKYFGNNLPPLEDLIKNVSMVLVNHHISLAFPRPYVPNMVEIGGFHVKQPQKLPQDIQEYLDNAEEGAIFFSLGSNIKGSTMTQDRLDVFLTVFSKLKYKILWKWENETLPIQLNNVKISPWFPQTDILAHPNIKLFITHGGILSTTEAVIRGVPLVGVPIFAEQPMNMMYAENAGYARKLDFFKMTAEELEEAVLDVMTNPKYRENVQKRSAILNDNPIPAMDRAVYWTEYVIRHKGAYHLRSTAQDLPWHSLYLIDVFAVLIIITVCCILTTVCVTKKFLKICGLMSRKSKDDTQQKKNN